MVKYETPKVIATYQKVELEKIISPSGSEFSPCPGSGPKGEEKPLWRIR